MVRPISFNPFRPDATASTSIRSTKNFESTADKTKSVNPQSIFASFKESASSFFSTRIASIWTGQDAPEKSPEIDQTKVQQAKGKRETYQVFNRLDKMLDRIETMFIKNEGLYRVSPGHSEKTAISEKLTNFEQTFNVDEVQDPHVLTALVKEVIKNIPGRLFDSIPDAFDPDGDKNQNLKAAAQAIQNLPKDKQKVLTRLVEHCVTLSTQNDSNKMTPSNLAIVFGPNITPQNYAMSSKDNKFFQFLIENPDVVRNPSNYLE